MKNKRYKNLKGIEKRREFLLKKGYDMNGRSEESINILYGMYHKTESPKKHEQKGWAMWGGTNRPHHLGGGKPRNIL